VVRWPLSSTGTWRLRHLYDGRFPFPGRERTLNALDDRMHFSQTAGLIALHPTLGPLWKRFGALAKALRARSFVQFGYDPENYFSSASHDRFGFVKDWPQDRDKFIADHTTAGCQIWLADGVGAPADWAEPDRELRDYMEGDLRQLPPLHAALRQRLIENRR
jgi:hypothetical protein